MKAVIFLFACLTVAIGSSQPDTCSNFCQQTYTPHTLEQSSTLQSCELGCRLYSLTELVSATKNASLIKEACEHSCAESYPTNAENLQACKVGCDHQVQSAGGFRMIEIRINGGGNFGFPSSLTHDLADSMWDRMDRMHDMFSSQFRNMRQMLAGGSDDPFDQMMRRGDSFMHRMMNTPPPDFAQMQKGAEQFEHAMDSMFAQMSGRNPFGNILKGLHGEQQNAVEPTTAAQEMGAGAAALTNFAQRELPAARRLGGGGEHDPDHLRFGETAHQRRVASAASNVLDQSAKPIGNTDVHGNAILIVRMLPATGSSIDSDRLELRPHEPSPPVNTNGVNNAIDPDDTLMSAIAHHTGRLSLATRWLLFVAMVLCIASMIWICLAIIRTAPRRRLLAYARGGDLIAKNMQLAEEEIFVTTTSNEKGNEQRLVFVDTPELGTFEPLSEAGAPPAYEREQIHGANQC